MDPRIETLIGLAAFAAEIYKCKIDVNWEEGIFRLEGNTTEDAIICVNFFNFLVHNLYSG